MAVDYLAFVQRELAKTGSAPSRRANKNRSGRSGRKQWNGQRTLQRVGGTMSTMRAIYAPADAELCIIVPSNVGWLPNGDPNRL